MTDADGGFLVMLLVIFGPMVIAVVDAWMTYFRNQR